MDQATVEAADYAARHWSFPETGPIVAGEKRHMVMFSRMLLETFNPYKPAVIPWPKLDGEARQRLVSLPIWDIAVQTEGRAGLRVKSFAQTITEQPLRDAFDRMAFEETRHKEVLSHLVAAYGINLAPEPEYQVPKDPEWGFLVTGLSECIDSFFAFGLFELARRSGFFPMELVETFEPVIQEEARHILFIVNWLAWHKANMKWWRRPYFFFKKLLVWLFLIGERIGLARDMGGGKQDANFAVTGSSAVSAEDVDVTELMEICLQENERRMAHYDRRLLRPTTIPRLVRFALFFLPRRKGKGGLAPAAHGHAA
jgi:hypothetical protein